jgi:hypothetical protein
MLRSTIPPSPTPPSSPLLTARPLRPSPVTRQAADTPPAHPRSPRADSGKRAPDQPHGAADLVARAPAGEAGRPPLPEPRRCRS